MEQYSHLTTIEHIAQLTLNRPESLNALDLDPGELQAVKLEGTRPLPDALP